MEESKSDPDSSNAQPAAAPDSPITFKKMGVPTGNDLQDTVVGKVRPLSDTTWQERLFLVLMLVSIITVAAFTIYRVAKVDRSDPDFTFGLVLLVQTGFCLVYLGDGILRERPSEIFILSVASGVIVFYLVMNYVVGRQTNVKLARMIIACALAPFLLGLGLYIAWGYQVSKKIIFRTVGADPSWQGMLQRLLVFQDLLKFDLQLGVSIVILVLVSGMDVSTRDIVVLAVGGPLMIVWFLLGMYATQVESKPLVIAFVLLSPAEVAYIIYKLVNVHTYMDAKGGLASATIICSVLALLVRVILMMLLWFVYRSFGKGLKEQVKSMKR